MKREKVFSVRLNAEQVSELIDAAGDAIALLGARRLRIESKTAADLAAWDDLERRQEVIRSAVSQLKNALRNSAS